MFFSNPRNSSVMHFFVCPWALSAIRFLSPQSSRNAVLSWVSLILGTEKSRRGQHAEYAGWGMITLLYSAKQSLTSKYEWAGALSWCRMMNFFPHNSGHFFVLLHANGAYYSLFTVRLRTPDALRHANGRNQWAKPWQLIELGVLFFGLGSPGHCHNHIPMIRHQLWPF